MKASAFLALLLVLLVLPTPSAQPQTAVDVAVESLLFHAPPTVNHSTVVAATVTNSGPFDAIVTVDYRYGDGRPLVEAEYSETAESSVVRSVRAGGSAEFPLWFTPPFERRGPTTIIATASAANDADSTNNTLAREVLVRAPKLNLTLDNTTGSSLIAEGVSFLQYHVRNDGNTNDTPYVTVQTGPGWRVRQVQEPGSLAPGATGTGRVIVETLTRNDSRNLTLNVTATSNVSPRVTAIVESAPLRVNEMAVRELHAVRLSEMGRALQMFPGENSTIAFVVQNTGVRADVFNLTASSDNSSVSAAFVQKRSRANASGAVEDFLDDMLIALLPGESSNLTLRLNATNEPAVAASVRVTASSLNAPLLTAAWPELPFNASAIVAVAAPAPALHLEPIRVPYMFYSGDGIELTVRMSNHGRLAATNVTLLLDLRDNLRSLASERISIPLVPAQGEHAVSWRPNTSEMTGRVTVTAVVETANATHENQTAATALIDVRTPELEATAPPAMEVRPGTILLATGSAGGLTVRNVGTHEELVVATLRSSAEWLSGEWRERVPPGSAWTVPVTLDVPATLGREGFDAVFSAHVQERPQFAAETPVRVAVVDLEGPQIEVVSPLGATPLDTAARVALRAEDAIGVAEAEALVEMPDGQRRLLVLGRSAEDAAIFSSDFHPLMAGEHTLQFRLVDASSARNRVTAEHRWTVLPKAYDGLVLTTPPNGTTTGSRILKFEEAQSGTTHSVEIDLGRGWELLPFPYVADASFWTDGTYAVDVRARSFDGVLWNGSFRVTMDTEPPRISGGKVTPQAEGRVLLEAEVVGADAVTAWFETPSGPVEVALTKSADGGFRTVVAPPREWTSVKFAATDTAGNIQSVVVAAGVEGQDRFVGNSSGLLALAALGLVAAGFARRAGGR